METAVTQTWMLGIFGFVIVTLTGLLVSLVKQGLDDNAEFRKEIRTILTIHDKQLSTHDTLIQVLISKTDDL